MGDTPPEGSVAGDSTLRTGHPSDTAKVGDGSLISRSSTGEKVVEDVDFARSGESGVDQKVSETLSEKSIDNKDYELPKFDNSEVMDGKTSNGANRKDKDAQSSLDENKESLSHPIESSRFDASETRTLSSGAEIKGPNHRPVAAGGVICDFFAKGWCIKGSSCRFLHIKDNQKKDRPQARRDVPANCKSEGLIDHSHGSRSPEMPKFMPLSREETFSLSFKDVGTEFNSQTGSLGHRDGLLFRGTFDPGYAVSSGHNFSNTFSQSRSVEELASFRHIKPHNYHNPSLMRDFSNSSPITSVSATGGLSALPFSSTSTAGLDSISSSLLSRSSHFSGSKPDSSLPLKRKMSSTDWEPSVPFQPSFLLRSMISLPRIIYNPLHDSVELPKVGDVSSRPSFYSQVSSIENTSETRVLARNDDTMSVSSHNTNHNTMSEVVGTSTGRKQENSRGSYALKDTTEATSDVRHQNTGPGNSVALKSGSLRQSNQMDFPDQTVNKESRELRHFRAALIDFVKEVLKPKWRDGHLSKAAHNKIVKKAVEKVLGTLPLEQVPTSMESVQQYLASSRGKIDKLVEGYAEIYSKV